MDDLLRDAQERRSASRLRLPRGGGAACGRCLNGLRFCLVCSAGALNSMGPQFLALAEALTVLLVYLLAVPGALGSRVAWRDWRYPGFGGGAEDLVALSLLRCAAVLAAHAAGAGRRCQRPYLYTALAFLPLSLPLAAAKALALRHGPAPRSAWPPLLGLAAAHAGFAVAHALAARRVAAWARRRYEMGLLGYGLPWAPGERTWLLAGHLRKSSGGGGGGSVWEEEDEEEGLAAGEDDVRAEDLADPDSRFADVEGLRLHYKVATPEVCTPRSHACSSSRPAWDSMCVDQDAGWCPHCVGRGVGGCGWARAGAWLWRRRLLLAARDAAPGGRVRPGGGGL